MRPHALGSIRGHGVNQGLVLPQLPSSGAFQTPESSLMNSVIVPLSSPVMF
jgi:hypothetical protein